MTNKKKSIYLVVLLTITFVGCSKDGGNPELADSFTPNVSFVWTETKGRHVNSIFLFDSTIAVNNSNGTGTIRFTENAGGLIYNLNCMYNRTQVQLHYYTTAENRGIKNGPDSGLTFKGIFTDTAKNSSATPHLVMRLIKTSNNTDSLVLNQHQ